ncbi:MAG: hypothetical protein LUI13_12665 [Lachnospiraceae bacterium]|nr:hypothetical protein [Lachnospiraceae bacterium]
MLKLMKYEFRKTMFSKTILLVITVIAELLLLAGIVLDRDNGIGFGIVGLVLCASFGILYIGLESLLVFQKDLNTKQSYMLFLTPNNCFQILGAKVIENGLSILLGGCFFLVLGILDYTIVLTHYGELKDLLTMMKLLFSSIQIEINITTIDVIVVVLELLSSWLMTIVTGMLAIVLSATLFAGKRFSGFVSFVIFLLMTWGCMTVINHLPELSGLLDSLAALVFTTLMYLIAGWIMERKLSV